MTAVPVCSASDLAQPFLANGDCRQMEESVREQGSGEARAATAPRPENLKLRPDPIHSIAYINGSFSMDSGEWFPIPNPVLISKF